MAPQIRRVRSDEWRRVRAFRLQALLDEAAPIAFMESHDDAVGRPDAFWQDRAARASAGEDASQLVAEVDGRWVGTATVLVIAAGDADHHGTVTDERRAVVVGVYVDPDHRGTGLIGALLEAAAAWTAGLGITTLGLDVHDDNARAAGAYRRSGFEPTGSFVGPIGPEVSMSRALSTPSP